MNTMPTRANARASNRGFTLVELIMVIVIGAVIATTLALFLAPAFRSFNDTRVRSDLVDQTDTALRRMLRDVRAAVPNSLRMPDTNCFELVPAMAGGRYRMGPDITNGGAQYVDLSQATTVFDSLTTLSTTPSVGDWVVIDNQNGNDVYKALSTSGVNRAAITAISTPAATAGKHRITVTSTQFPSGYDGGRFLVVSNSQQAVSYVCSGTDSGNLDANGNGKGTLYRVKSYGFNETYPTACESTSSPVAPKTVDVIATNVKSCKFVYDPNQGATQQSGFLWLELAITRNSETAYLAEGAHVMNAP